MSPAYIWILLIGATYCWLGTVYMHQKRLKRQVVQPSSRCLVQLSISDRSGDAQETESSCPTKLSADDIRKYKSEGKIEGGVTAEPGRYPYMVSLQSKEDGHICGGVLVEKDLVLTAAHCVDPRDSRAVPHPTIRIGGIDVSGDGDSEDRSTCYTVLHPKYLAATQGYDLALIELDKPSKKTPIKLPSMSPEGGQRVHVLGWGVNKEGRRPASLQEANLTIVANEECSQQINEGVPNLELDVLDSMLCAQLTGVDACKGDSGGPLVLVPEMLNSTKTCGEEDILAGITSFGFKCTDVLFRLRFPGIYTNVRDFVKWIESRGAGARILNNPQASRECSGRTVSPTEPPKPKKPCRFFAGRWVPAKCNIQG